MNLSDWLGARERSVAAIWLQFIDSAPEKVFQEALWRSKELRCLCWELITWDGSTPACSQSNFLDDLAGTSALFMFFAVGSLSFARFLLSSDKTVMARVTDTCTFQIYISGRPLQAQAVFLI